MERIIELEKVIIELREKERSSFVRINEKNTYKSADFVDESESKIKEAFIAYLKAKGLASDYEIDTYLIPLVPTKN
ncbi:hypothetical protein [Halobacillus yeomjeoni]|uniref:Uncharacterized protein n=1 Tax=Halobacillus yeomjeoni TaxID=311194 RepID=A0A931HUM6_9BACI|nr:hypothetical protein [Halobacillus yeomjeoni]MBH0229729.1 hypothetical protein [Halobacillus yeomjeoni]